MTEVPATLTDAGELLDIAMQLADTAETVGMGFFQSQNLNMWAKADGSRVTDADVACEHAVLSRLSSLLPADSAITEETGGDQQPGDRWILDPIDGTENFSRGNPVWGTLIAREVAGQVAVAVISAPALGQRWWAVRQGGAFTNDGRRLKVSALEDCGLATFCYGGLHECPSERDKQAVVSTASKFRCAWGWGNFWGHVQVAQGITDAALSFGTQIWDVAAAALLVAEAGGSWSDTAGEESLVGGSLLTSNGQFHAELVAGLSPGKRRVT